MEQTVLQEATDRIRRMEQCFDLLQSALHENPPGIREDASFRASLSVLTAYYENGLWLQDYTLDEQGLLPQDLKRGVLAQDAVYDFLSALQDIDQ